MKCPNCQQDIEPTADGFTPHFNRDNMRADETTEELAQRFDCPKDPRVIDPLSGALSTDVLEGDTSPNVTVAIGNVDVPPVSPN